MFEFMKRLQGENKKAYKKRLVQRGTEIINGINCSEDEKINLIALMKCQTPVVKFFGRFIDECPCITEEEYALRKGMAKDYEKFIEIVYFKYLDKKEFAAEKAKLWDEVRSKYIRNEINRDDDDMYFDDFLRKELNQDEQLILEGEGMAYSKRFKIRRHKNQNVVNNY